MKYTHLLVISGITIFSIACKSSQKTVIDTAQPDKSIETNQTSVLERNKTLEPQFTTAVIKGNVLFETEKESQKAMLDIRVKKNEIIWINVKILGYSVAKALLTPEKVQFYEKGKKTYFDGDYQLLTQWLGTTLDFKKVQNLLLGMPLYPDAKPLETTVVTNGIQCKASEQSIEQTYVFSEKYQLLSQFFEQNTPNRTLWVQYIESQEVGSSIFPKNTAVEAKQTNVTKVMLEYKNVTLNEDINYPFEFPKNYNPIEIK